MPKKPHDWLRTTCLLLFALIVLSLSANLGSVAAQEATPEPDSLRPHVSYALERDLSPAFSTLQAIPGTVEPGDGVLVHRPLPKSENLSLAAPADAALQSALPSGVMPAPGFNFEGIQNVNKVLPPDTNGDVGPDHYVQWVNLSLQMWRLDRENGVATPVYSQPIPGNKIWEGFGGPCESSNDGDPIVLYDHLADRWLLSQFALPYYPSGPFYQCIAVSQTGDPSGAWFRYAFMVSETKMNDYPHFGVWPDGYYLTINQFKDGIWAGAGVLAFERERMLQGLPARQVYFDLQAVHEGFGGMLPADLDGPPPPPGTPGLFAEVDDASWIGPSDAMRLWEFHVDWTDPERSTFGLAGQPNFILPVASFTPLCAGVSNCIPQPGTNQRLDALGDRLMHRLQYRNFGSYATLVANHTVDAGGRAGARWYELRQTGGEWRIHQQGTYAGDEPNSEHRWMASAAVDGAGNLALGYSVSSERVFPSIRYAGRLAGDPPGVLAQGEATLVEGGGVQLISNRWGDYSSLAVDPVDDCTFWFTSEYYATTSNSGWTTRVGSFAFPNCLSQGRGYLQGYVTDNSTGLPLSGVHIQVGSFTTQTGDDGFYQVYGLQPGSYSVTASAYGFEQARVDGVAVSVVPGGSQNFSLTPIPFVMVKGYVRDGSGQNWPLYARLEVSAPGYAGLEFTDPASGFYSLKLAQGVEHTLTVSGVLPGYTVLTEVITPTAGGLDRDFSLGVNTAQCTAPGYLISSGCQPQQGALMIGQVYDANTGQGVIGAEITVEGFPASRAISIATPGDPDVPDGYYALFNAVQGTSAMQERTVEVSSRLYGSAREQVILSQGEVIRQDFYLPAGLLTIEPLSLSETVNPSEILTRVVTIRNTGGLEANFRLSEVNAPPGAPDPTGPFAVPTRHVSPKRLSDPTAAAVYDYLPPAANSLPGGGIYRRWATGLVSAWGLGVSPEDGNIWVGDAEGEDGRLYRFHQDGDGGEATLANGFPNLVFSADMTFDPFTGTFWQVRVGGDNCLSEVDPARGLTGSRICPPFNNPQRGLAFDPMTQTFYSASWVDGVLYHFDRSGRILDSKNLDLNVSGLAYNPASGHLFALVNANQGYDVYVLDAGDGYRILGGFDVDGLDAFSQGGLDMDCSGHLWLVHQARREVFEVDSGEASACTWGDIPWLEASPSSGGIAPGGSRMITLTFHGDSAPQQLNQAHLVVTSDTPYPALELPLELRLSGYDVAAEPGVVREYYNDPGSWAITSVKITNRGLYSDYYQISSSGNTWETVIRPDYSPNSEIATALRQDSVTIGPILPGASTEISVRVFIPESAKPGDSDHVTVSIVSKNDPEVITLVQITNSLYWQRLFPVINR